MTKEEIKDLKIFKNLSNSDFNQLYDISIVRDYSQGKVINFENDKIEDVFFLLSGFVKAYKIDRFDNEVFLYTIKDSGLISTFLFYEQNSYFANTECLEDSSALLINHNDLQKLIKKNQNIFNFFAMELMREMKFLQYILNRQTIYDGTAKVAHMLANSLEEFNSLKKQAIAYMLNIQPETLSRILAKLKRDKIIETSNDGKVSIININKLLTIFT